MDRESARNWRLDCQDPAYKDLPMVELNYVKDSSARSLHATNAAKSGKRRPALQFE